MNPEAVAPYGTLPALNPVPEQNPFAPEAPTGSGALLPNPFHDPAVAKGTAERGDLSTFYGADGAPITDIRQSAPRLGARSIRRLVYIGFAGAALAGVAACSSGGGVASKAPSGVSAAPTPGKSCVTHEGGETTIDLACEQRAFPSQLPAFIQKDQRSVVTVAVSNTPNSKGYSEIAYASGSVIGPNLVLTAGHDTEVLTKNRGCDRQLSYVDSPAVHGAGRGNSSPLEGLYDNYVTTPSPLIRNTDEAVAVVGGSAISQLPELTVRRNVVLPAGTRAVELSMQAKTVGANEQSPTDMIPADRKPDIIKLVALGPDRSDPHDTDFAAVGTYTQDQLSAPIAGSSGASVIPLTGPNKDTIVDVSVVGLDYIGTSDP